MGRGGEGKGGVEWNPGGMGRLRKKISIHSYVIVGYEWRMQMKEGGGGVGWGGVVLIS